MSFLDDLLRTLRAPLDFVRGKTSGVRSAEGRVFGDVNRVRNLPREYKGELEYNKGLVQNYGQRVKRAKDWRPGQGNASSPARKPEKKKMGLFSKKRRCESCGEKLDARWELCPYCGHGGAEAQPQQHGSPPRTQALDAGAINQQYANQPHNQGGYASPTGGNKPRTMALDAQGFSGNAQSHQPAPSRSVAWLIPLDGPQGGQLLELRARGIVGTAPDCDVVVKDPSVSGRHAELGAQGGVFRVSDLGSTNGTFVNDKRVQSSELVDGDTLRLGRTSFKFKST